MLYISIILFVIYGLSQVCYKTILNTLSKEFRETDLKRKLLVGDIRK
nr:MAG TPA: hypothetical protein [Caudoviricetes sp.]